MEIKEIRGKIVFPEGHDTHYVNGAFGSMNNHGEFLIHFFKDIVSLPNDVIVQFEDNKVQDSYTITNDFNRKVISSIILSPENARNIAKWILNHIEQSELAKSGQSVKE